ncbi:MAG TPA: multidrug effflux MFS transporter [Thermohalobaculum sp.]|nr:multidrug effflux MFS transporter [Thermohalobaculum sp.]
MPRKASLVALLAAVTAIGPFSLQALSPALPDISADFSVPPAVAQLMLSLSLVAMAVTTLAWGPVSDRLGRRPVMVAGMLLAGAGSALAATAPNIWLAVLGRLMQASGAVAGMVLARAVAQDLYGKAGAAAVIGQITAAMVVAPMVAPALSGLIVERVGWRGIFALVAAAAAILAIWAAARLPETVTKGPREHPLATISAFGQIGRQRVFWAHATFGACSLSGFLFFVGAAPYVMQEAYGTGPSVYGFFFMPLAATYMLANMACGRLTARHGARRMIVLGGGLTIGAMAAGLIALSLGFDNPLGLMIPAFFHSVGAGLSVPNSVAGAVGAAPDRAGAASGLLGFIQFLSAALTTQVAGFLPHDVAGPTLTGMTLLSTAGLLSYLALSGRPAVAGATGPAPHG